MPEKIKMENQPQQPRGHYSPEEKQQIIGQWKQSGLNRQAFCRANNLSYHTLIHWTRKPRTRKQSKSSEFIPIKIKSGTETIFAQIETGGKRIQLYQPVTANFLKQLL